jgi:PKD repeat protein
MTFQTVTIPDDAIITSANLTISVAQRTNTLGSLSLDLINFTPANSGVYAATDYSKTAFVPLAQNISYANINVGGLNTFILNSDGLSNINKTGNTTFLLDNSASVYNYNLSLNWTTGGISGYRLLSRTVASQYQYLTIVYITPPVASFTASNQTPCSSDVVQFNDTSTNTPTAWDWRWWSNETTSSSLQNPTYQFPPGEYNVRLYASNADGGDWENKTAFINSTDCTPPITSPIDTSFTSNVTCGNIPFTVQFNDTSTGAPTIWNWSFGDGNYSEVQNPVFEYNLSGLFTINFSANNTANTDWMNRSEYIRAVPNWANCPPTPTPAPTWGPEIMPSTDNEIASPSWVDYMISFWWVWLLLVVGYIMVKK